MNNIVYFSEQLYASATRRVTRGDRAGALVLLDEALLAHNRNAAAAQLLAELVIKTDPARAAGLARAVLADQPGNAGMMSVLGQALDELGETAEAVTAFEQAAVLDPGNAGMLTNVSLALLRTGRAHEALQVAHQALACEPNLAVAHANVGHALCALNRHEEAIAALVESLKREPDNPEALTGIATAQTALGLPSAALLALQRVIMIRPRSARAHAALGGALQDFGAHDDAIIALRRAVALEPDTASCANNLLMAMQYAPSVSEADAVAEAANWGARQSMVTPVRLAATPRAPERPLRIGYVTADLWSHPVGWLGGEVIARHTRPDFRTFVYANQTIHDFITERVVAGCDGWREIIGRSDAAVAGLIAQDGIDILVDLSGHTGGNRLGVFARRPAPIQASWLGYFATTGLPVMDAIFMDDEHIRPGGEAQFTEQVIRLDRGRFCYTPPAYAPDPAPPPSLAAGVVTFGSFNNGAKLNRATLDLFARVMHAVPDSRLVLKWRSMIDPELSASLRTTMAAHGIDGSRLHLEGKEDHLALLGAYGRIDIALDPTPFSGALTTCEALWMGVPVVTLPGTRAVSRQTHSILSRLIGGEWTGCQWSASSETEYVAVAAALANDFATRSRLRYELRAIMRASPLCDPTEFAASLERAYRTLWRGLCAAPVLP